MADPATDASFDEFLSSTAPKAIPSQDADFDQFLHESAPVSARAQLDDYKAGKLDLNDDQVKSLSKIAQDGVGSWQSLGRGVKYIFAHPIEDLVNIGGVAAKGLEGIGSANEALMAPERQLHAELSTGHPVDALWNYGINKLRSSQEISQGALRGVAGLAPVLGGAAAEIAQLDAQPFLNKEQEQEFNARTNAGVYQSERLKNLAFNKAAAIAKINPESPLYTAAENIAPMAVPFGGEEALGSTTGKIANAIVDKGTVATGKIAGPAAAVGEKIAPAAAAAATFAAGHPYIALGELLGGYGGMRGIGGAIRRVIDAPFEWTIGTAKTLASTPEGETIMGGIRSGLDDEVSRLSEQLGDNTKFTESKIADSLKTRSDGVTPLYATEELSGPAKQYRELQNKIADIQKKSASLQKYEDVNRVLSAGVRTAIKGGLDAGVAGMIGAGFAGSTESPGEYEQARQGFAAGAALGGAAALVHAPITSRNAYRIFLQKELIRQSQNNMAGSPLQTAHQGAMNVLPKPAQDYVNSYAAMANANGHNVAVLNPVDFVSALKEQEGIDVGSPDKAPYGFYSEKNKTAYVRSDALHKGVVPHEVTHALETSVGLSSPDSPVGKALDAMLDSKDPAIQAQIAAAKDKYATNLMRSVPNMPGDKGFVLAGGELPSTAMTREGLKSEILADLGADLLHQSPPEALYGGRSLLRRATGAIGKMLGQQPTTTAKYGFPVTPELREAMADQLFDIGSRLKSRTPAPPGAIPTVTNAVPEPVRPPEPVQQVAPSVEPPEPAQRRVEFTNGEFIDVQHGKSISGRDVAFLTDQDGHRRQVNPQDVDASIRSIARVRRTEIAPSDTSGSSTAVPAQVPAAPSVTTIDPQAIKDAIAGMTALKFKKTDAQARIAQAAHEAAERNLTVTANDLLAHGLSGKFPNEKGAVEPPASAGPEVEPKYSDMLWQKAMKGEVDELGVPSQVLLDAREGIREGTIKTREDFDNFLAQKYQPQPAGVTAQAEAPRLSSFLWDKVLQGDVSELGLPSETLLSAREAIRDGSIKTKEDFENFLQTQYGKPGETTEPAPAKTPIQGSPPVSESAGVDRPVQQPGIVPAKNIEGAGEEAAQSLKQSNPRATEKEIERARVMAMAEAHTAAEPDTNLVSHRVDAFGKPGINGTELDPSNPMNKRLIANAGLSKDQVAAANLLLENKGKNVVLKDYGGAPTYEDVSGVTRKTEQTVSKAQDRAAGKADVQHADKNFVPSRIVYNHGSGKNNPSILVRGFSPDKFAHNATQLFPWLDKNGFNVDAKGEKLFTGPDDPKLVERFNDVVQNQSHGYTGNGEKAVEGTPFTSVKPDPDYTPVKIPDEEFHVVNALIGAAPPEVAKTPIQQNTKVLTRLNAPGGEPNPIWAKLGDEKRLLESTIENVKPELIGSIDTSNSETPKAIRTTAKLQGAPRQDFSAGGFLPREENALDAQVIDGDRLWLQPNGRFYRVKRSTFEDPLPEEHQELLQNLIAEGKAKSDMARAVVMGDRLVIDAGSVGNRNLTVKERKGFKDAATELGLERVVFENEHRPAQFLPQDAPEPLRDTAKELGLRYEGISLAGKAHAFTDEKTGSTIDIPKDATPDDLRMQIGMSRKQFADNQQPLFQPSDHENAIEGAAVKMPDGRIFKSAIHPQAIIKAKEYYEANEESAQFNKWLGAGNWTDGFTTKQGQFLDRVEAMAHAKEIGQVTNKSYSGASKMFGVLDRKQPQGIVDQRNLESLRFDHARAFLPADQAGAEPGDVAKAQKLWIEKGTSSPFFKKWFEGSKVIDESGKPITVYHGTNQNFSNFALEKMGAMTGVRSAKEGIFFTDSPDVASDYAALAARREIVNPEQHDAKVQSLLLGIKEAEKRKDWNTAERLTNEVEELDLSARQDTVSGQALYPAYLSIHNPKVIDAASQSSSIFDLAPIIKDAKKAGHDGVIIRNSTDNPTLANMTSSNHYVVFNPEQVKSAIGNSGTFNPADPDIRFLPNEPEDQPQSKPSSGLTVSPFTRAINPTRKRDHDSPEVSFPVGTAATNYNTPLSDSEEKRFEKWKAKYAPKDSGDDYDLRGAFKYGLTPENGHWDDLFKKPNHPTFSDFSVYAKQAPDKAGHWSGEVFNRPINLRKELEGLPALK